MPCKKMKQPRFLDRVTFIANYALDTCSTPWNLYLRTGGRSTANLALGLVGTSWDDIARELFRPKGQRILSHGGDWKRNQKRGKSKALLTDTAELVGKELSLFNPWEKPKYTKGDLFIWEIDNFFQRQLYKVLVVNLVTDFAYDWWSGILLDPDATCSFPRLITKRNIPPSLSLTKYNVVYQFNVLSNNEFVRTPFGWLVPEGHYWFVLECDCVNSFFDGEINVFIGVITDDIVNDMCALTLETSPPPGKAIRMIVSGTIYGPCEVWTAHTKFIPDGMGLSNWSFKMFKLS